MKLERLTVRIPYGESQYVGEVEFSGPQGAIRLNLNETLSKRVLDVVGDVLVETSKECAVNLTAAIIDAQTPALAPPE